MKVSNSKKQLARLLIEAGVTKFPEGADWVAQGRIDLKASFYGGYMPKRGYGETAFCGNYCGSHHDVQLPTLIPNWHQSVLSRDEFDQIVAETAPDADGWVEWKGGECPVGDECIVSYKMRNAETFKRGEPASEVRWAHNGTDTDIIAYRLHKPEQAKLEFCESVMRSIPEPEAKPTIEQLAADYRNKLDYADRKQDEADKANMESDAALSELEKAISAIGFAITPICAVANEPELVITDWRDLQVGDEIRCVGDAWDNDFEDNEAVVTGLESNNYRDKHRIRARIGEEHDWGADFIFIRRTAK